MNSNLIVLLLIACGIYAVDYISKISPAYICHDTGWIYQRMTDGVYMEKSPRARCVVVE